MDTPTYRVDLHVHARWSADAIGDLDDLARVAQKKGLHGLALTEHNTTRHHEPLRRWNRDHSAAGFRFYPGIEITTREGHLLAIGVQEEIPKRLGLDETLDRVQDQGGIAIPAHPHRLFTGIGAPELTRVAARLTVVEVHNAQEVPRSNRRTRELAHAHRLSGTGGSDAHQVHDVGNAVTLLSEPAEDLDALLAPLRRGRTRAEGGTTPWKTRIRQRARIARRILVGRIP